MNENWKQVLAVGATLAILLPTTATAIMLSADPSDTNAIDAPRKVVPVTATVPNVQPGFLYTLPAYTITILQLKDKR